MNANPFAPADPVDGVLTLYWASSKKPNASELMRSTETGPFENLMERLRLAQADEAVQVIVLRNDSAQLVEGLEANAVEKMASQVALHLCQMPQPIVAMVFGQVQEEAIPILQACDIVIATNEANAAKNTQDRMPIGHAISDWVTLYFPAAELEAQTYKLARELAAKDSLALRFTKKTVQQVAAVSWNAILNFTTSQQVEIKSLQAGRPSARALAIESFLAGKSKPGAGA